MSIQSVITNLPQYPQYLYQSMVGPFNMVDDNYDSSVHEVVPGVTIKIDLTTATAMNLFPIEQYASKMTSEYAAFFENPGSPQTTFNWHFCTECVSYFAFLIPHIITKFAPDHFIMQDTVTRLYAKLLDYQDHAIETNTLDYDVCSYGNCYADVLTELDFRGLDPQYHQQRLEKIAYFTTNHLNFATRISAIKSLVFTEEHIFKSATENLNDIFMSNL